MFTKTVVVLLIANFLCVHSQHKGRYFPGVAQTNKQSTVEENIEQTDHEAVEIVRPDFRHTEQVITGTPDQQVVKSAGTKQVQVKSNIVDQSLLSKEEQEAIKNAKYVYGYQIDDRIKGGMNEKYEERKNGKVTGYYTYDDRNILRKVTYEADENGFRVISDEILPSKRHDIELNGVAIVKTINNAEQNTLQIKQEEDKTSTESVQVEQVIEEKPVASVRRGRKH